MAVITVLIGCLSDCASDVWLLISDYSASLGSEEESGKDWDELEEEARKGKFSSFIYCFPSRMMSLPGGFLRY